MRGTLEERFWAKVKKGPGCWLWTGATRPGGYGNLFTFRDKGRRNHFTSAHRASWEIHYGPIPDGLLVCHRCDNPPCVKPEHLFLGTNKDNQRDRRQKGRAIDTADVPTELPLLTPGEVLDIQDWYEPDIPDSLQRMVEHFEVSAGTIRVVAAGHRPENVMSTIDRMAPPISRNGKRRDP
tara:strand:- start:175 stop:714 length:540 start_codon:yes stop_codon:yes gene_type:complete